MAMVKRYSDPLEGGGAKAHHILDADEAREGKGTVAEQLAREDTRRGVRRTADEMLATLEERKASPERREQARGIRKDRKAQLASMGPRSLREDIARDALSPPQTDLTAAISGAQDALAPAAPPPVEQLSESYSGRIDVTPEAEKGANAEWSYAFEVQPDGSVLDIVTRLSDGKEIIMEPGMPGYEQVRAQRIAAAPDSERGDFSPTESDTVLGHETREGSGPGGGRSY